MFSADPTADAREAERKMLQATMAMCGRLLESMRGAAPADAARLMTLLENNVKSVKSLPPDFKRKLLADARRHACDANMRAADAALARAMDCTHKGDVAGRNRLIAEARALFNKAIALGAPPSYGDSANRKIDIILLTGGVENKGPTAAKPRQAAPKPANARI